MDDYWDRGLLGLALDPSSPPRPYVYVLYAYDAPLGATAPVWNDACSDAAGPPPTAASSRAALAADRERQHDDRRRAGPGRDWCQQFPSHSIGTLPSAATARCTPAPATAPASTTSTTASTADVRGDRRTRAATRRRRPARHESARPPRAARCAARASGAPAARPRWTARSSASTRTPGRACRATRLRLAPTPTPGGSWPTGCATRSGSRIRPGTNELWIGDVGWNTWEEIDRLDDPDRQRDANFGWPCYEGAGRRAATRRAGLNLCQPVHHGRTGGGAVLHLQPQRARRRGDAVPHRAARRSPAWPSTRPDRTRPATEARCSSPTTPATASGP